MASGWFLYEEAIEASWWAVTGDGWVVFTTVWGIMIQLQVPAFPADPAAFVRRGVIWAGVDIVHEEEAPRALSMLDVQCGELYHACLTIHVAWDAQDAVSSVRWNGE